MADQKPNEKDILAENASLKGSIAAKDQTISALQASNEALSAQLRASIDSHSLTSTERDALRSSNANLEANLATAKAAVVDFDKAVAKKVAEHGIAPHALSQPTAKPGSSKAELLNQYNAITDPVERTTFYRTHKAALMFGS